MKTKEQFEEENEALQQEMALLLFKRKKYQCKIDYLSLSFGQVLMLE